MSTFLGPRGSWLLVAAVLVASCAATVAALAAADELTAPKWLAVIPMPDKASIGLRWTAVPGATGYQVLRSTVAGKDHKPVQERPIAGTEYLDSSAASGTTYHYLVRALRGDEKGPLSEERSAAIPAKEAATASAPQWSFARGEVRTAMGKNEATATLAWQAPQAGGTAGYNIYRKGPGDSSFAMVGSSGPGDSVFVDRTVEIGTPYTYVITALDANLNESPRSPERTVTAQRLAVAKLKKDVSGAGGARGLDVGDYDGGSKTRVAEEKARPSYYRPSVAPQAIAPSPMARGMSAGPGESSPAPEPSYDGFGETFDEVWVISRPEGEGVVTPRPDDPGSGELRCVQGDGRFVPFPLRHTEVTATVTGYVARVGVRQSYRNPYSEKIEAVYVFPLPENAAVSDFVMTVGDRKIRGIIREREEATRIYQQARDQGYVASLLTQERPNIFTQKVANIEPGKAIDIDITYFNTLAYEDGFYTFAFPMVVGPRYNPAGTTNGVGAVSRGAAGISGQSTEVQYLRPGERSGSDIMVTVDIDAGVPLEEIESPQHAVIVTPRGRSAATVRLRPADTVPNKDFVLRYKVAGKQVKSALMVERGERGGFFTLMLQPPANLTDVPRGGLEMVFLLDVSGSMSGHPVEKSKAATRRALQNLRPDDTFQIVTFASGTDQLSPQPLPATPQNIERGLAYLDHLSGGGGTEMLRGIRAALDFPHDPRRLRYVAFMTDGYIGNEDQILAAVAEKLGPSRIFAFGVGTSVNRYLIEGLARLGKGAVAYLLKGDSDTKPVNLFFERIAHAALADITVDWGGMQVSDVYPKRIPDLFVGRPVMLTGRFTGRGDARVRVSGMTAGEPQEFTVEALLDDPDSAREGISLIWARARIADLSDAVVKARRRGEALDHAVEIRQTALDFGLVSAYTAFVAVDSSRVTEGDHGTTVVQPVPVPDGVRYDTTVQGR